MTVDAPAMPEIDVARIRKYCATRVPEHALAEVRVDCDVTLRHVTIVECRAPWRDDLGPEWSRTPIARLHYTKKTGTWTLYWPDRHSRFHRYGRAAPSPHVQNLLDAIDSDPTGIFWG